MKFAPWPMVPTRSPATRGDVPLPSHSTRKRVVQGGMPHTDALADSLNLRVQ